MTGQKLKKPLVVVLCVAAVVVEEIGIVVNVLVAISWGAA